MKPLPSSDKANPAGKTSSGQGRSFVTYWLRSPLGWFVAKPWFDWFASKLLDRWFFAISRLWAAARTASGSVDEYLAVTGLEATPALERKLTGLLTEFESRRGQVIEAEARWREAFFGEADFSDAQLRAIEADRLDWRNRYNSLRGRFLALGVSQKISPILWDVPTPQEMETIYGPSRGQASNFPNLPTTMPEISRSKTFNGAVGPDHWLEFKSPSDRINDMVCVRVHEPVGVINPPTLIFGHGICVEFDHWHGLVDEVEALVKMGIRVVRPEAPAHGRRVPDNRFGGERFIATIPAGPIDHFSAAIQEWAVLIDWCRKTTTGPVAVGGSSLGAMTAHLVADRAKSWPSRLQPDAMFLITHSRGIGDAMFRGRLSQMWGIKSAAVKAGWTQAMMDDYMSLLETGGPTVVQPENIVSVLGTRDNVTPYDAGDQLLRDWGVPEANKFQWRRGHYSVPLTMMRDHAPLQKFRAVMEKLRGLES